MMSEIKTALRAHGYFLVRGGALAIDRSDVLAETQFVSEWDGLELDNYLKNGARFRERRYGRFRYVPRTGDIQLLAHRPYFQSEAANSYAGGIHRVVAPVTATAVRNPLMNALIEFNFAQFPVEPDDERFGLPWEVACHQFRTIASDDEVGEPTPEGIHRDEIDYGAIHLISRTNATGGESRVYDNGKNLIANFVLESRWDTLFWADQQVLHAVTPTTPTDSASRSVRDILILGYTCKPDLSETD
jgi:hypothetical protein